MQLSCLSSSFHLLTTRRSKLAKNRSHSSPRWLYVNSFYVASVDLEINVVTNIQGAEIKETEALDLLQVLDHLLALALLLVLEINLVLSVKVQDLEVEVQSLHLFLDLQIQEVLLAIPPLQPDLED